MNELQRVNLTKPMLSKRRLYIKKAYTVITFIKFKNKLNSYFTQTYLIKI